MHTLEARSFLRYLLFVFALQVSLLAKAQLSDFKEAQFTLNGKVVGYYVGAPQIPQPDRNTCGAATQKSVWRWEMFKLTGWDLNIDTGFIYNLINSNGEDGLITPEMLAGFTTVQGYLNTFLKKKGDNRSFKASWTEGGKTTIYDSVEAIWTRIRAKRSSAVFIGNRKTSILFGWLTQGSHYYGVRGGFSYVDKTGRKQCMLILNDSLYNSPAWPKEDNHITKAIEPTRYIYESELSKIWTKTGSSNDKLYRSFNP